MWWFLRKMRTQKEAWYTKDFDSDILVGEDELGNKYWQSTYTTACMFPSSSSLSPLPCRLQRRINLIDLGGSPEPFYFPVNRGGIGLLAATEVGYVCKGGGDA